MQRLLVTLFSVLLLLAVSLTSSGQAVRPSPSPTPTVEPKAEDQVKVFTEEVRLPVNATDTYGHYDPTLEVDDVLVLEDGVPQQIKSVRHIPANVLLILDTGGDANGLAGLSKKTSTTCDVALRVVSRLRKGDQIAVLQSSNQAELLQPWTNDLDQIVRVLKWKLFATKRSRIFETMAKAAQLLSDQPEGSRHVILITDGVESPGGKVAVNEAIKQLVATRATVHIISYTEFVRQQNDKKPADITAGMRPPSSDPIAANDPTRPTGTTRTPSFGVGIRFDPAMTKVRKAYEAETRKSERWLTDLAAETGGRIFLPISTEEMIAKGEDVARDIGAEYVVTYRPTRPLAEAKPGEYRKVQVASRRVGLYLRSRRGYVVPD
ncbi:MAG: Ca-activated chloride channel [Blastocatellia bacterium]|nr:Ca-activated chloride channel [Blastocatellia bacterium]